MIEKKNYKVIVKVDGNEIEQYHPQLGTTWDMCLGFIDGCQMLAPLKHKLVFEVWEREGLEGEAWTLYSTIGTGEWAI